MPITIISGFLGAGKTSFLQNVLENDEGTKYGLLINDMASVNIDSKQIRKQITGFQGVDALELQNGCVCCTLAEDLISSVTNLVRMADDKHKDYDHIVIECSGIAEPRKIRELFQAAEDYGDALLERVKLDTLVTVVDASVFLNLFGSNADLSTHRNLASSNNEVVDSNTIDEIGIRKVTDLLLEQVECADCVLINKIDLLSDPTHVDIVTKVIREMNPTAQIHTCERGQVKATKIVGFAKGTGAASIGVLDEHRKLVQSVLTTSSSTSDGHEHGHEHSGIRGETTPTERCDVPNCTDVTHGHDHTGHSHGHSHGENESCQEDHDHSTHSHSHSHNHGATTAENRFGITSFVYQRRRPFHPTRISAFLQRLGTLSYKGMDEFLAASSSSEQRGADDKRARLVRSGEFDFEETKKCLLRSKGFIWLGTSSAAAYFISHAGTYLELSVLGRWWADIEEDQWPPSASHDILVDFDGKHGDRRQEIVFIGQFDTPSLGRADTPKKPSLRTLLEKELDSCLLTDEEMAMYEENYVRGDNALRTAFYAKKQPLK